MDYTIIDLETTAVNSYTDRIVELSMLRVDEDGRVVDAFDTLLNPRRDASGRRFWRIRCFGPRLG